MSRLAILTYMSDTGLGVQCRAYAKHLNPSKVMVVDLSQFNHMPLHPEWYPEAWRTVRGFPTNQDCDEFLEDVDVLLIAETPLSYRLFETAKKRGIKTCLAYNYEFLDQLHPALKNKPLPDILAAPTSWHIENVRHLAGANVVELPVPIDLEELPSRQITQARHFFHVAGRPAVKDRNGTLFFIASVKLAARLMPDARFTLYLQQPTPEIRQALATAPMIERRWNVPNPADMYLEGDIHVLPRRYGGLCLSLNESIGSGIPVLMTDVSPNSDWLPKEWLIPVKPQHERFMTRTLIDVHSVQVPALAQRMIDLYRNPDLVQRMHEQAKILAQQRSWETLKPRYEEVLGL